MGGFFVGKNMSLGKMSLAQIITDFKNLIGPAGKGSEVGDTGLKVWANDAYFYIISEIQGTIPNYFTKLSKASSQTGVGEYATPSDFDRAILISISYDGTNYVKANPIDSLNGSQELADSSISYTTAAPLYYIFKNTLGFLPVFDQTLTENIKLWHTYEPAELSDDSDQPDLPRKLARLIKYYMYANYLDQNDEHVAAERMRLRFEGGVKKEVDQLALQSDEPRSVQITNTDLYYNVNL